MTEHCAFVVLFSAHDCFANEGLGRLKMREWKMRDRQKRNVENTGLENLGPKCRGGKCEPGRCGTDLAFPENVICV